MNTGQSMNRTTCALIALFVSLATPAAAQDQEKAELAKQLSNPIAALISFPIQLNWEENIGSADTGNRLAVNLQPVVPLEISENWNLISRTILPVVWQDNIFTGAGSQFGLGDVVQTAFFSPKAPAGRWIWGAGPVLLLPTGTDELLSAKKWGIGPSALALTQRGPITTGALVNHIWSVAGDADRGDLSATFLQPFFAYNTPTAWTFTLNTESTYDWKSEQWSVPIYGGVTKVTNLGGQLASVGGGLRYWAASPDSGPEGLAFRFLVILLFPK